MSGNRAKELALAHWEGYVQPTIEAHMPSHDEGGIPLFYSREKVVSMCRHHYLTAWEHGAKHEREAQKETAREAMQPLPESVTGDGEPPLPRKELEGAATCAHYDGTICLVHHGMGTVFDCYHCMDYKPAVKENPFHAAADYLFESPSPLSPVFALITEEYHRSLAEHTPWEEAGHSADTMLKVVQGEVVEVDIAISMNDYEDTVKEWVHVANVAVKAIVELTRRGRL